MPVVTLTISEAGYQRLKEKALQAGYSSVSEFLMDIIEKGVEVEKLTREQISEPSLIAEIEEIKKEITSAVRRIHDIVNPYTSKIDELSRKTSELIEKMEKIESMVKSASPSISAEKSVQRRRTALDYLRADGFVFQSDLTWLRKPEAFFTKLKKEGAYVIESSKGYVAIDKEFYESLLGELEKVKSPDSKEVLSKVSPKARRLLQVLLDEGLVIYDINSKRWKAIV